MLLALCALGALWDLLHPQPVSAPPVPVPVAAAAAVAAGSMPAAAGTAAAPVGAPLDLNAATASQLDALPGIGPVLAARIVEHRQRTGPFRSPDELLAVRGIGPHVYSRLRPLVTVAGRAGAAPAGAMQNAIPGGR